MLSWILLLEQMGIQKWFLLYFPFTTISLTNYDDLRFWENVKRVHILSGRNHSAPKFRQQKQGADM